MTEQHRRGLAADARHAGNVVDSVAGQREETGHALGLHAEALRDLVVAEAHFADVIPVLVARADELRRSLSRVTMVTLWPARAHARGQACRRRRRPRTGRSRSWRCRAPRTGSRHRTNCGFSSAGAGSRFALYAGNRRRAKRVRQRRIERDRDVLGRTRSMRSPRKRAKPCSALTGLPSGSTSAIGTEW